MSNEAIITTRIIGVGSPFGADRIGWLAVEYLQQQVPHSNKHHYEFITLDRPGLALVDYFKHTDQVILLDACKCEQPVLELDIDSLASEPAMLSSHAAGVAEALQLGSALEALPQSLRVIGIQTSNMNQDIKDLKDEVLVLSDQQKEMLPLMVFNNQPTSHQASNN